MGGKRRPAIDDKTARLLDANLNRAREGLRVLEDTARFVWDDAAQYRRLRALRHELGDVMLRHYRALIDARESVGDPGRRVAEGVRESRAAVVAANIRRAQEATRVLEEYGRVFSPAAGAAFKSIRYRLYQEEKELVKHI